MKIIYTELKFSLLFCCCVGMILATSHSRRSEVVGIPEENAEGDIIT